MRHTLLLSGAALLLVACNTTPTKQVQTAPTPPPADIRVEESIGFTIVETAEIDAAVRVDYDRALALIAQGRINDGIAVLETVVEQAPELSAPRVDLAIAWHRLDDLDAAEEQLDKVLEINPQHPIALNELGIVYRKTARFAEARQSYEALRRGRRIKLKQVGIFADGVAVRQAGDHPGRFHVHEHGPVVGGMAGRQHTHHLHLQGIHTRQIEQGLRGRHEMITGGKAQLLRHR